jgi:ATP-binding cassette, subfamily B, multidrug efflux pump
VGQGAIDAGTVATALPLAWTIANVAGWVSWEVTGIFENIGVVQEGMETIAVPHAHDRQAPARANWPWPRRRWAARSASSTWLRLRPHDGKRVLDDLSLHVRPGERVGIVGRSGAGKSTLVNLLLRFHDTEQGIGAHRRPRHPRAHQESLRAPSAWSRRTPRCCTVRSRPTSATAGRGRAMDEIVAAAKKAQAHEFILGLQDWKGRTGYEAHVGERGVKLRAASASASPSRAWC